MNVAPPGPTPETIARRIASLVREKRLYLDLTKAECARRLNIPRSRWVAIENGTLRLYVDEIETIMNAFSIKAEQIWPEFARSLPATKSPDANPTVLHTINVRADAGNRVVIVVNLLESSEKV
jgi:transcriptional regulator with XRE-family HTH domain